MENKKTIIAIVIVVVLIVGLVVVSYLFNKFNNEQVNLLTEETNKLLKADLSTEEIDFDLKTERNYAIVEKSVKEYLLKLKNIYVEIDTVNSELNPNDIFSAKNLEDKNFEEIDKIINEYTEKSKNSIAEYKELVTEENIIKYIEEKNISTRKEYYIDLYKTAMLNDVMKEQYNILQNKAEKKKDELLDKLNTIEKIKKYLEENDKYWNIKDDKIQFTNINRMTGYYNLLNTLVD